MNKRANCRGIAVDVGRQTNAAVSTFRHSTDQSRINRHRHPGHYRPHPGDVFSQFAHTLVQSKILPTYTRAEFIAFVLGMARDSVRYTLGPRNER